jgi:cell division inhibitor SepF
MSASAASSGASAESADFAVTIRAAMGFADLWTRTLVYFGIAEEDDYWDEDGYTTNEELERGYAERPNVRRLPRRARQSYEEWSDSAETVARPAVVEEYAPSPRQPPSGPRRLDAVPGPSVRVHLVVPRGFNDAQQIADKFKDAIPVILNLQTTDQELSKRLIDFASGLTYALNGGMQRVADKVFLLTPRNVEVSAEERARLLERGGFFNQA